tara:strand:- start:2829 stop:3677 length:849 start_codon:yes stop_codon:yes gene_type:complete
MKCIRVIPRLDIKGPNLVKGIHLEGLRVLGLPEDFARYYYQNGADELIYQDTVASLYGRNSLNEIITKTAKNIFIPLTVGGGIRSIDDINNVLRAGADKVSINTAAIKDPDLIRNASKVFGSSTIVINIETIKSENGDYLVYTDNGREFTGINAIEWAKKVQELGAGEILLTSIDKEGTGGGFDNEIIKLITQSVEIPVIAHGGAGKISHIKETLLNANPDAIAIASILHYSLINKLDKANKKNFTEGNLVFLENMKTYKNFREMSIMDIKLNLKEHNIITR